MILVPLWAETGTDRINDPRIAAAPATTIVLNILASLQKSLERSDLQATPFQTKANLKLYVLKRDFPYLFSVDMNVVFRVNTTT